MNPNRLLQQNGLLVQQNNSLNTSLNNAVRRIRSIEQQLEEHKIRLANALKDSSNEHANARALSAEKKLEEHNILLSNATVRALSAEQQLQEHKTLVSNATARALSAEKQLEEHNRILPAEKPVYPSIHITRTKRS